MKSKNSKINLAIELMPYICSIDNPKLAYSNLKLLSYYLVSSKKKATNESDVKVINDCNKKLYEIIDHVAKNHSDMLHDLIDHIQSKEHLMKTDFKPIIEFRNKNPDILKKLPGSIKGFHNLVLSNSNFLNQPKTIKSIAKLFYNSGFAGKEKFANILKHKNIKTNKTFFRELAKHVDFGEFFVIDGYGKRIYRANLMKYIPKKILTDKKLCINQLKYHNNIFTYNSSIVEELISNISDKTFMKIRPDLFMLIYYGNYVDFKTDIKLTDKFANKSLKLIAKQIKNNANLKSINDCLLEKEKKIKLFKHLVGNYTLLSSFPNKLKTNLNYVIKAVRKDFFQIKHAPDKFKKNKDLIIKILKKSKVNFSSMPDDFNLSKYVDVNVIKDKEFLLEFFKKHPFYITSSINKFLPGPYWQYIDDENDGLIMTLKKLQSDSDFVSELLKINPLAAIKFCNKDIIEKLGITATNLILSVESNKIKKYLPVFKLLDKKLGSEVKSDIKVKNCFNDVGFNFKL